MAKFFTGWKLKQTAAPCEPIFLFLNLEPVACAASSTKSISLSLQIFWISIKSHGIPAKWTGKISFVLVVIDFLILSGSMHNVLGSTSTKIGFPPLRITECAVETNDNEGRITSLFLMSNRDNARFNAAVPLLTAIQLSALTYFLNNVSNSLTLPTPFPDAQKWLFNVLRIAFFSESSKYGSNNFIFRFIFV